MRSSKVHLREKQLAKGMIGFYLDYSINGKRKQETLNDLRIFSKPKCQDEKNHNKEIKAVVSKIAVKRELEILNNTYDESVQYLPNASFYKFLNKLAQEKNSSKGNMGVWKSTMKHVKDFDDKATFKKVLSEDWQYSFQSYLLGKMKQNSAQSYFSKFRCAIKKAFKLKIIPRVVLIKGIPNEDIVREYLTIEELKVVSNCYCENDTLKRAFLFSCLTGLRWSDVTALKWKNVSNSLDQTLISYRQQKTKWVEALPLNEEAVILLGERDTNEAKVFKGLKYSAYTSLALRQWLMRGGVTKNITFHCARHTYAHLLLSKNVDIYTVSKMLGHKNIKTTLVYAKFDQTMQSRAIEAIPSFGIA